MKFFDLELIDSHYYIKRASIVEKIIFNHRTFYSKFERIDDRLTPFIIQQHLNKEYIIAVPLIENNLTNYLVINYRGEENVRFYHLIQHILKKLEIDAYQFYEGDNKRELTLFIEVKDYTLEDADKALALISSALEKKMTQNWKCLPSSSLPARYNIITLPYKKYSLE